jgi:hypothetical protein
MGTQFVNGKTLPSVNVMDANFKVDYDSLDLEIGGGILSDISNIFLFLFDGIIKDQIESQVKQTLKKELAPVINQILAMSNGNIQFDLIEGLEDLALDINMVQAIQVTTTNFGMGVDGTFFDVKNGEYRP